jgi:hypothetical protein
MAVLALPGCKDNDNDNNGGGGDTPATKTIRYRGIHMANGRTDYDPQKINDHVDVPIADIEKVGRWGANFTRWQIAWCCDNAAANATPEEYRAFLEGECDILDTKLPVFKREGIKVCLAMFEKPGGRPSGQADKIFTYPTWADVFVETWEYLAERYKDNETIAMYDLMNEPYAGGYADSDIKKVEALFVRTATAIRAIDPSTEIVFEPNDGFNYKGFVPFDIPGVVYSYHVYYPHLLTHQGVILPQAPLGPFYPGYVIEGQLWDSYQLRNHEVYRHLREFSKKYDVRILIGEFGCARWAPKNSAYNYIKDCIDWFEEEGWDWNYFCLIQDKDNPQNQCFNAAANAWCAERDTIYRSTNCDKSETNRVQLLKSYFERNKK